MNDVLGLTAAKGEEVKDFLKRYKNARKAIAQIRAGEWEPIYNSLSLTNLTAKRGDLELWIGNGPWFCEISGGLYFGLFWRHYVWWAAASAMKQAADKACHSQCETVPSL